jgi:hypothetical protein
MIKRIEQWLIGIFRKELSLATAEIAALRAELSEIKIHIEANAASVQLHAENVASELKQHAIEVAADLHTKVAADAKAVALLRNMVRLPCVLCGQMSGTYENVAGKIICLDCRAKGRTA